MILWMDYESRSPLDLTEVGVDVYFSHPKTEILMMAYAFDDGPVEVWEVHKGVWLPDHVYEAMYNPAVIKAAWNAGFERTGTEKKMGLLIPFDQWYDPSVGARYMSMPGGLDRVGKIIGLPVQFQKNEERGAILRRMFTEPIPVKKKKAATDENTLFAVSPVEDAEVEIKYRDWNTNPAEWREFVDYCRQDVVAERAIAKMVDIFPLPAEEVKMWYLDQKINWTGLAADRTFASQCFELAERDKNKHTNALRQITGLENPNSNQQFLPWIQARGYPYNSLRKEPVKAALTDENVKLTDEGRKALGMLKYSKKTSYTKLQAIVDCLGPDDRLRDQFLFYGSPRAGRWSGRDVQLQNMARPVKALEKKGALEKAMELIRAMDYDGLTQAFPKDPVIEIVTSCIRSAFVAAPGMRLDVADLNAIENRVLGWVSGEDKILQVFREGKCPYISFAAMMYNIPYATLEAAYLKEDPDAKEKRQIGKPAVLGSGYRMAGGDWGENKYGDRVKKGLWGYAENMGIKMTKDQAHTATAVFRGEYKKVVNLWYDSERAVARCLKSGSTEWIGPTKLIWCSRRKRKNGTFVLVIHLPSGRCLHYLDARVEEREQTGKDGTKYMKDTILYKGVDSTSEDKSWKDIITHGGKLTENIVQAISRDLIAHAMLLADEIGLRVVGHVHDEIITENPDTPDGLGVEDLEWCMSQTPVWAPGLPLTAKGYSGKFYKK